MGAHIRSDEQKIVDAFRPQRTASGGYRLENEFHILIARA